MYFYRTNINGKERRETFADWCEGLGGRDLDGKLGVSGAILETFAGNVRRLRLLRCLLRVS